MRIKRTQHRANFPTRHRIHAGNRSSSTLQRREKALIFLTDRKPRTQRGQKRIKRLRLRFIITSRFENDAHRILNQRFRELKRKQDRKLDSRSPLRRLIKREAR